MTDYSNLAFASLSTMNHDELTYLAEELSYFISDLCDVEYFEKRGHADLNKTYTEAALTMLIMMLDKLEANGLFKPNGWRNALVFWQNNGDLPELMLED